MEVKKIPSSYERQQVNKMAERLGFKIYYGFNYDETEDGKLYPRGDVDRKYALLNADWLPSKTVPYRMTFYELKDKLIFLGGVLEEVV